MENACCHAFIFYDLMNRKKCVHDRKQIKMQLTLMISRKLKLHFCWFIILVANGLLSSSSSIVETGSHTFAFIAPIKVGSQPFAKPSFLLQNLHFTPSKAQMLIERMQPHSTCTDFCINKNEKYQSRKAKKTFKN